MSHDEGNVNHELPMSSKPRLKVLIVTSELLYSISNNMNIRVNISRVINRNLYIIIFIQQNSPLRTHCPSVREDIKLGRVSKLSQTLEQTTTTTIIVSAVPSSAGFAPKIEALTSTKPSLLSFLS
ncbi:hypothetical protein RRG08_056010 [Elysia crispata]|uniref:Uncharacterized protein n=1 Tax=Elysia crispata TaxID=231223 RepID=A0AAE1DY48_9GAST|nr:hypothetical protein RRG08_056010 [Elysia crispata]